MSTAAAVQTQTKSRPWWLTLISGILATVIGATMLRGIFDIISIFIDHSMWGWKLFIGIVSLMAGYYIVSYPIVSAIALPKIFVLVLGIWGLMYGIILLIMAFQGGGWGAGILGVLGIIFGIALMGNYYVAGMGLAMLWTAALFAFFGGIVMIVRAFQQRSA